MVWCEGLCHICSFITLAGIILASRMFSGQPTAGQGYESDAIAAAVLGGTSFTAGSGRLAEL